MTHGEATGTERERQILEWFRRLTDVQQRTVTNLCRHYVRENVQDAIRDGMFMRLVAGAVESK